MVGGQDQVCQDYGGLVHELYTLDEEWLGLPIAAPANNGTLYPSDICITPLNSTHILYTGGYVFDSVSNYLPDAWILDLESLLWTETRPMPVPRSGHGCVLDGAGEVFVAGGYPGGSAELMYNPDSQEWRLVETGSLPSQINDYYYQQILAWNNSILLLETNTENIWLMDENGSWTMMNVSMGAEFKGGWDTWALVNTDFSISCLNS